MVPVETQVPNPEQLDFMTIQLKVGSHSVTGNLHEDLMIPDDPEMLIEELAKYPSMLFYWSSVAEVAKAELSSTKRKYEIWFSKHYGKCRKMLVQETGKTSGITEAMVKSKVVEVYGEEYSQWMSEIEKAEYRKSILSIAANSFKEKGSAMINSLSWKKANLHAS